MSDTIQGEARLSFVTLEQFLAHLPAELTVLHDTGKDPLVRWVEPSELRDPTQYLLPGEFLLTAGLPFLDDGGTEAEVDAYVRRLVAAEVCALGFGLEPYFDEVPGTVVDACVRHGLTLIRIPHAVPFAAVGLHFAQLLETDSAKVFRSLADANRALMRSVLSSRPEQEVLATLTQRLPCWAVLVGPDGRVRGRAGRRAPAPAALQPLVAALLAGRGPRVEVAEFDQEDARHVVGHPLRSARDATLGALLIGSGERLTPAENNIASAAVGLLELVARQRTSGSLAPSQLATALLLRPGDLSDGSGTGVRTGELVAQSLSAPRSAPGRALAVKVVHGVPAHAPRDGREDPAQALLQLRRLFDTKLVELTDYGFAAITRLPVSETLQTEVEALDWLMVLSRPVELSEVAATHGRIGALRSRVLSSGRSVREDAVPWSLAGLLGPEAGRSLAEHAFAALADLEPNRRETLLGVLRAWLNANGSWDASAKSLGLHRNSVRRQIAVLGELLQRDLADAQTRAELLIALRYLPDAGGA